MARSKSGKKILGEVWRSIVAMVCCLVLMPGDGLVSGQTQQAAPATTSQESEMARLPADQLDSLVAPIALYPDPMLAQVLAASTYPLEIIQLQQWLGKNKDLKDKALEGAVMKQPWDPSVQALAGLPEVVKRLAEDIQWTTDLGNAFLAQEADVMDAVQRMRKKAEGAGNLKSNEQQKVETKVVETKQVIVIEQANPQVVYVPSYNPVVVYGPPVYPYPPIYYPPPGYYAAGMAISFGIGVAMGAMWGGGWGWGCGWGGNNVNVNINNNFNRNTNVNGGNRGNRGQGGGGNWQHNPQHRGGTPYGDRNTAGKYGGTTRGASVSDRQANARQNQGNRAQSGNRPSQQPSGGNRSGPGVSDRSSGGAGDRGGSRGSSGAGGDRVGNRSTSPSSSRNNSLGGSGSSARASSSRGSSSMGSGGGSRSGGGRRR
ncbi:MAG: DUF3300 domain-containing protein [Candidatus Acidiferrum sp.]